MKHKPINLHFLTRSIMLALAWVVSLGVAASAESNAVVFELKNGGHALFKFEDSPKIKMSGNTVKITDNLNTVELEMENVARFFMADAAGVESTVATADVTVTLDGSSIVIAGLAEGTPVNVFTIDGTLRASLQSTSAEAVYIEKSKFPTGVLIIATPENTFKILNK